MPVPRLPHITVCQEKVDRLGWTDGTTFSAFGLRFGLRSNDPSALSDAAPHTPLGWQSSPMEVVDILYRFARLRRVLAEDSAISTCCIAARRSLRARLISLRS